MTLTECVAVYVPRPDLVPQVARFLAARFGGATALPGHGYYINQDGSLVQDPTTLVYAWADRVDPDEILSVASKWAEEWQEECVGVEVSGAFHLVYPEKEMIPVG